jgi:hypothetical protein
LGLAVLCFAGFFGLVMAGQRGGDTFFSNPALSVPILTAAVAAVAAGVCGVVARRAGDRSLLLVAAIVVGAVVLFWTGAEIAFPH